MSKTPAIMLEALYGDDFEHQALDFLVRVARSYLDLATEEGASIAQRARDVSAAIEILQVAGEEILHCAEPPLADPWGYGRMEGRRAAAMLDSIERPEPWDDLMTFELSLHVGDPHDPSTEPTKSTYSRQPVTMDIREEAVTNTTKAVFPDLPLGKFTHAGLWARGRLVQTLNLNPAVNCDGETLLIEPGALRVGVL